MYTETFITEPTIEECYDPAEEEPLYFNDEWLDEDLDEDEDWEPDDEFFAYVDDIESEDDYDGDHGDDYIEAGFNPYLGCYDFDC